MIHDVNPTILGGEDEQSHESVEDVVKVVLLVAPLVLWVLQTVGLLCDVLTVNPRTVAIEEKSFEKLTHN